MTPKLVIFDCDGVLVDSETITNRLLAAELTRRGMAVTVAEVARDFVGGTLRDVARRAAAAGASLPDGWVEAFYEVMYDALAQGTALIPGVEAVLDRLDAAGIPCAVASNGSERKMGITLSQHPGVWERLRDHLFSAHRWGTAKPEPGLLLAAAGRFGVAPADCVMIDDSASGCTAAARAGIPCLGFAEHDDGQRLAATGATIFHRMADLPGLLGL